MIVIRIIDNFYRIVTHPEEIRLSQREPAPPGKIGTLILPEDMVTNLSSSQCNKHSQKHENIAPTMNPTQAHIERIRRRALQEAENTK